MAKKNWNKSFYTVSAIVGLALLALEIGIFQYTIITFKIPFLVTMVATTIGFFIVQKNYKKTYQNRGSFLAFGQSLVSFGLSTCYLFMALNHFCAHEKTTTKSFPILYKHTIGTKNPQPAIEIDYEGLEKQLVFYRKQQEQLENSQQVVLTVKKGFFGYDVLRDVQLK